MTNVYMLKIQKIAMSFCVYMYHMLNADNNEKMIKSTKNLLNSRFDMKAMRYANAISKVKISKTSNGLIFSQSHYIDKILKKFSKDDFNVIRTPSNVNLHLSKNKRNSVSLVEYFRVIESLIYLISCTRPNIVYIVSELIRYTNNLSIYHSKRILKVLRYLRCTHNCGLHYSRYFTMLKGYIDID